MTVHADQDYTDIDCRTSCIFFVFSSSSSGGTVGVTGRLREVLALGLLARTAKTGRDGTLSEDTHLA